MAVDLITTFENSALAGACERPKFSSLFEYPSGFQLVVTNFSQIAVAQVIDALEEQPFGLTECTALPGVCSVEAACRIRPYWQRINAIVRHTLESVSVADMVAGEVPDRVVSAPAPAVTAPGALRGVSNIQNWSLSK